MLDATTGHCRRSPRADPVQVRTRPTLEELSRRNRDAKPPSAGLAAASLGKDATPARAVVGKDETPPPTDRPGTAGTFPSRPSTAAATPPSTAATTTPAQLSAADKISSEIAAALLPAIQQGTTNPLDLLKLGLGLGMGLGATNSAAFQPPSPDPLDKLQRGDGQTVFLQTKVQLALWARNWAGGSHGPGTSERCGSKTR